MSKEIFYEGTLANGREFSMFGRAHNGSAKTIDDGLLLAGQDVLFAVPEHNIVGVFDGAGGTTDIGSPELAAITAANAVLAIVRHRNGDIPIDKTMKYARQAVIMNKAAGICVGGIARVRANDVELVNAGDTGVVVYSPSDETMEVIGEQQIEFEPLNYLGRQEKGMPDRIDDLVKTHILRSPDTDQIYVMSDGVLGNWKASTDLNDWHFQAAHGDYLLLKTAEERIEDLEGKIRRLLVTKEAVALKAQQMRDHRRCSPELENPELFSIKQFDWDIWYEIVKPYIVARLETTLIAGERAVSSALATRQIAWEGERPRRDDASIVRVTRARK